MSKKWKVWKRDGAWWVLDERGRLRYASSDHMMALSFALMQSERNSVPPRFVFSTRDLRDIAAGIKWSEAIQSVLEGQYRLHDTTGFTPKEQPQVDEENQEGDQ